MTKDDFMNPLIWVGVLFLLVVVNRLGAYLTGFPCGRARLFCDPCAPGRCRQHISTATVNLVGSNKSTKVDGNGHYILAGVPPGSHIIEATTNGTSKTATLNVRPGEVQICHITL
jgi:hypothetical protein